jgi:curved DNA-binding protein CbpA
VIDLYEVLQVDRHAEPEVIRGAYRALARKYHPDFGGSAGLMASINEAWAVLGDAARRAAYDGEAQGTGDRPVTPAASQPVVVANPPSSEPQTGGPGRGLAGRRAAAPQADGTVLDFGRYAGWTIGRLVDHDPDYLEWLARTTIGRHLTSEIDAVLARRAAEAPRAAAQSQARRRAFL